MTVSEHLPVAVSASSAGAATGAPLSEAGSASRPVTFTGSWPSAAAWGAGLVLAALGAGAIVGPDSTVIVRAVGVVVVTLGLAALVWGGANLAQARLVAPAVALTASVVGVLSLFALLALAPARTSVFAVAIGTVLLMVAGASCALVVRRGRNATRDAGTLRGILGMLLAAAVIAVLVTPALGATQDAHLLRDDGTVPAVTHDGH